MKAILILKEAVNLQLDLMILSDLKYSIKYNLLNLTINFKDTKANQI
jgi:hypothetical protein